MKERFTRLLAPIADPRVATVFEAVALPVLMMTFGAWISPEDPLFVHSGFPWAWLAPLLLALRYGPIAGLGAAGVLLAGWFVLVGLHGSQVLPKLYFLGGLMMTMLAGEFASVWRARLGRAEATQDYLDRRLDSLTRTHYLLRLSHESLEQDLLSRPVSMRDALVGLRELVAGLEDTHQGTLPAADKLLKLTVQFCQVEHAAVVPVSDGGLQPEAASFLGTAFMLDAADPLIRHALEHGELSHVASQTAEHREDSRYLVVAPVTDAAHGLRALLVIEALPFLSLQEDNLQVLNLMLGYYADSIAMSALVAPLQAAWPACPAPFALELQRLHRLRRDSGVPSALVAMVFPARGLPEDLPMWMLRQQRSLDVTWMISNAAGEPRCLLAILPLAPDAAVEGYLARIERWLAGNYDSDLAGLGIHSRVWHLGQEAPPDLLARILETCDVAAEARLPRTPV